ncbi:MAG: PilZ domain-containing protein [Bryobacteraceae bacterium]
MPHTKASRHGFEERRSHERFGLRCRVLLFRDSDAEPVRATSMNLSSKGIYWISAVPFRALEKIGCAILLTSNGFRAPLRQLCLECKVEVVRTERTEAGYGVGARIEKYTVSMDRPDEPAHGPAPE